MRHTHCRIQDVREEVADRLGLAIDKNKMVRLGLRESPEQFWQRAEAAGKLGEALAMFDRISADRVTRSRVRRETKAEFAQRIEREGRRFEVEEATAVLQADGLSQRVLQERLIERFQPLDGYPVRPWTTPDPWLAGRLFRRRHDHDECERLEWRRTEEDVKRESASDRLRWARIRRDERQALAAARRRLQGTKTGLPTANVPQSK